MDDIDDLKLIKKYYGETMAHLCRGMFPTALETPGLLFGVLSKTFAPSKNLYDSIFGYEHLFKSAILNKLNIEAPQIGIFDKSPKELLDQAGYDLFECHTEEEIQSFKKYYAPNEALCTFRGGRLDRCFVFFAVKKNVEDIKRENFLEPRREDDYGISVISIQFTKDSSNTLSIKNRYNHTVNNPDATYGNNLENIIPGLTEAFNREYGLNINSSKDEEMIPGFVMANDGKYYKYNYEIDNVYYCPDNTIIDHFDVKTFDKEKYVVADYFIIDLVNKKIMTHNNRLSDSFANQNDISKIDIIVDKETKNRSLLINNGEKIIKLNKLNQIISISGDKINEIPDNYLWRANYIKSVSLPNVSKIGDSFLEYNRETKSLDLPNVETIGHNFLLHNNSIEQLYLPNVKNVGNYFLPRDYNLYHVEMPNVKSVGNNFLQSANILTISLPNVEIIGDGFLSRNTEIIALDLPIVQKIGHGFLSNNEILKSISLPNVETIGDGFLGYNDRIDSAELPKVKSIGKNFLGSSIKISSISLPEVETIGDGFLTNAMNITSVDLPNVREIGNQFLSNNNLKSIDLPNVNLIGSYFMNYNNTISSVNLPNAYSIDSHFLDNNYVVKNINIPNVSYVGDDFAVKASKATIISPKLDKKFEKMFHVNNKPNTNIFGYAIEEEKEARGRK